ncbi:MAG TPA: L-seryl-tRNA(Sec) selenium transferase [Candidatus Deferrimicrobium sp.]|nr:L-seryl-tRNA(Sec) selenium transferase [Candidatus Deferrimicrobium sp.]
MAKAIISQPRDFPAIEELLEATALKEDLSAVPRPLAAQLVREVVAQNKARLLAGRTSVTLDELYDEIRRTVATAAGDRMTRVINATGIIVHTNLGRAPLSRTLFEEVKDTVCGYSNVEFDLSSGGRGRRGGACERYLALLAGSESATIVNNCAAALFLILNTLANRKAVLISRGELVQIGGGFRIPDILKKSGAKLCEVGTTNVTTLADYEKNLNENTTLILKVHKSNFIQAGFTEEVPLRNLTALGSAHDVLIVNDLGSGALTATEDQLGAAEPTVQQSVRDGADLTCFSGDKLLGGVQAGLIVGRTKLIDGIKRNPLFRTFRVDKIAFAMLERVLASCLNGTHQHDVELWRILSVPESELYQRGKEMAHALGSPPELSVEATQAYVGGGALPEKGLPSAAIVFHKPFKATALMQWFRSMRPPIIGRIENERFMLDLKAVAIEDLPLVQSSIKKVLEEGK